LIRKLATSRLGELGYWQFVANEGEKVCITDELFESVLGQIASIRENFGGSCSSRELFFRGGGESGQRAATCRLFCSPRE
jgi:hypothetical protein